jgi:hypothetical protein
MHVQSGIGYKAQAARDGRIELTANNGFFDRCFEACDQGKAIPGDEGLINASFGYLGRLSDQVPGTARWHLWCAEAGQLKATFFMEVPADETNHVWVIKAGDERQRLTVHVSDGRSPQEQTLTFTVPQPGKVTFAIDCTTNPPAAATRIYSIRLDGSAVNKASLLRTRWRPSAVHARFCAPPECPAPGMWVFETVNVSETTSYSPLTTPFGYFGTSFKSGGAIPPGAGFNFSMWIAGRGASNAPPIEKMARLIGTDIPDARYSTFGSEGTGVRFAAVAYKNGATRTIQALRREVAEDGLQTYYGYFYDEDLRRWRLYASAQTPGRRGANTSTNAASLESTGSFCEIPGPPNRERSGDLVREIKRRGWFFGSDEKWYRAMLPAPRAGRHRKSAAAAPESMSDERVYYMQDYETDGWMGMRTGGMDFYPVDSAGRETPPARNAAAAALPEYLSPAKTAQLFELPVVFGESKASAVSADKATIDCRILKTGPNSRAILYYGTVDCLTYSPQKVTNGSAVQIDMFRPERTWQSATPEQSVTSGSNSFQLEGLKSGTTYYYRLFVAHENGKSWDDRTGSFTTLSPGA